MTPFEQLELDLEPFGVWLERQPPPAWSSLADVPLDARVKAAWKLAKAEPSVDERCALLSAAVWPAGGGR